MARHPEWFERLDPILETVRHADPLQWLGRTEMKAIFGCSERDSIRLLHKFGAEEHGNALSLSCSALRLQLQAIRDGRTYAAFLGQRRDLARKLATARAEIVSRQRRIAGTVDLETQPPLASLPAGVTLTPGRILFEFSFPEDFWAQVDGLANHAAQNPQAFEAAVVPSGDV